MPLVVLDVAANHINIEDVGTVSGRAKIFATVVVPVAAGALSALKTTVVAYFRTTPLPVLDPSENAMPVSGADA